MKRRFGKSGQVVAMLGGAAVLGFLAGGATTMKRATAGAAMSLQPVSIGPAQATVSQCHAVDGDTLRCGGERIRLIGIDSPEMPGHCREGRHCVEGDPFAAKDALSGVVGSSMTIRRFGTDHYGRTLALVSGPAGDLSCAQLRGGHAIYREDWDVDGAMMKGCG